MTTSTAIEQLPSVGPIYASRLHKLNIFTLEDLITHFPFRYDDFSLISPINRLQIGETVTVQGTINSITSIITKRGRRMQKAIVSDTTGKIGVIWFNQPYLVTTLRVGTAISLSGKVGFFIREKVLESPEYELLATQGETLRGCIHTGRLVPIYPETYGVSSKWLRVKINFLLSELSPQLTEFLPNNILTNHQLIPYQKAIRMVHFPASYDEVNIARRRLAFDELFLTQLASHLRKNEWNREVVGKQFKIENLKLKIEHFINKLPFKLTNAQERCVHEILVDLGKPKPMNRLLQGDVGSGKTVVATIAMYVSHLNGFRSICMAPTEILANQHFQTLKQLLAPYGIPISLQTGSTKMETSTKTGVVVGTHAILYAKRKFDHVGLVVIDEQHRFGVEQRAQLTNQGEHPHLLSMTATPIPRTVALTLYSELDLSVIDQMPVNRIKIKTWLVPNEKRKNAYQWITKELTDNNSQAFVICPLIEESDHETLQSVKSATTEFTRLKKIFPKLTLGLLHGRMKAREKDAVLNLFRDKKIDILVATPVVEVGIDIPNATIMVIEAAERFGLAAIHQLRGRVGRGEKQSYCLLFTEHEEEPTRQRLKSLETLFMGAALAELDLKLRGPGDMFGTRQHGYADFKIATLSDTHLIHETKDAVIAFTRDNQPISPLLQATLKKYTIASVNPN